MKSIEVAGASFDVARLFELIVIYGDARERHSTGAAREILTEHVATELRAVLADVAETFDREGAMSVLDDELGAVAARKADAADAQVVCCERCGSQSVDRSDADGRYSCSAECMRDWHV